MHFIPLKCNFHTVFYQTNQPKRFKLKFKKKPTSQGLERWCSVSSKHQLLLQSTECLFPEATGPVTTIYNASSRKSDSLFWFPRVLHTHSTHAHFQANTLKKIWQETPKPETIPPFPEYQYNIHTTDQSNGWSTTKSDPEPGFHLHSILFQSDLNLIPIFR